MAELGPGGGITGSLLIFSPLSDINALYMSSSATATRSLVVAGNETLGTAPIANNPLNTKLFYLGSGVSSASIAAGWYGSETSSFSGSRHNMLFWMYGNSSTFPIDYSNLYYNTFQTRSITSNTFGAGIYPFYVDQLVTANINSTPANIIAAAVPPTNAPSYNYQLIVSKSTQTSVLDNTTWTDIIAWTSITQDSLRSGSGNTVFETSGQGYKGQFNISSGTYTFIRGNLPTASVTPVRAIPVNYTISFEAQQVNGSTTTWGVRIVSGSTPNVLSTPPAQTIGTGTNYVSLTFSGSLNIYSGSNTSDANLGNVALGSNNTMRVQISQDNAANSSLNYRSASLVINQPLTGKQVASEVPLINIFNPTNTPTTNDTGSYYVITPSLRGVDNISTQTAPGESVTQMNFPFAVYYFKTAYHLWRDAWRVQAADGGTICSEEVWISASTNPSWAGSLSNGSIDKSNNNAYTRQTGYFLYSSRSSNYDFIDYGIYSTDAAVRNRSYVGITAELLGGSDLIKHLKGNYAGTVSASFPGNKFGGAIVVKASRVSTDSITPSDRYFPGSTTLGPSTFIWYKPGDAGDTTPSTYFNFGLPPIPVNDGDVVPLSNFGYDNNPDNMKWPTNIPWPPANPNISNSFYGYP